MTVTMLGNFPPPLGGAAKNNLALFNDLRARGVDVRKLNVSGPTISHVKGTRYFLLRAITSVRALARVLTRRGDTFYIVPDAGVGVWLSLAHTAAASLRYSNIVIHHRTCSYIDKRSPAVACMVRVTRRKAVHVFLTREMAARFADKYGAVEYMVCSNAKFVSEQAHRTEQDGWSDRNDPLVIGHLSNLCAEKGFFDVVEVFESLVSSGINCELRLAGPAIETEVQGRIADLIEAHGARVHVAGPIQGAAKDAFYREIDVFLFPTHFKQEAAPNVLYEAFAGGAPAVTTNRGCISDIVGGVRGIALADGPNFAGEAAGWITAQAAGDRSLKSKVLSSVLQECAIAETEYLALLQTLGACAEPIRVDAHAVRDA